MQTEKIQRPWVGKAILAGILAWILLFGTLAYWHSLSPRAGASVIESPFKPWDGVWEGTFEKYAWDGELIERLRVRQEYKHAYAKKNFRQEGRFTIENPATGEKTLEQAINTTDFEAKRLKCQVIRDNGRRVDILEGRFEGKYLFWSRNNPGTIESFREWIEGDTYCIEGFGIYGDPATAAPVVYVGRYQRIEAEAKKKEPEGP